MQIDAARQPNYLPVAILILVAWVGLVCVAKTSTIQLEVDILHTNPFAQVPSISPAALSSMLAAGVVLICRSCLPGTDLQGWRN